MRSESRPGSCGSSDIHETIARDYERIFELDGTGSVGPRMDILRAVLHREDHFTPEDIQRDLDRAGREPTLDSVAQTLASFVRYGLVWEIRAADQPVRYEHLHLRRYHDHAICVRCGRVNEIELPSKKWAQEVERATGYRILHGQIQLRGVCGQCLAGRPEVFPLTAAGVGEELVVVRLEADGSELKHLLGLGLCKGTEVQVLHSNGAAGSIIAIDKSRVAVPREVMERVLVRPPDDQRRGARVTIPLTELGVGRSGRIARIRGQGPMRHRLLEMGVTRGASVFVERVAPLGDPIEVTVKGYYLAIRKAEAAEILVEP